MFNTNLFLEKIKTAVKTVEAEADVVLFGSRARGEARSDSDWDILILTNQAANLQVEKTFRHKLFELELEFGQAISTFIYPKLAWLQQHLSTPLYKNIKLEGRMI